MVLSHIYQYRAGVGDYSGSISAKSSALQKILKVGRCRLTLSNPRFNAPGAKRLILKYDELVSNFAFNFNLRRCIKEEDDRLGSSGVNEMGLNHSQLMRARLRAFRVSAEDDAFAPLTPEDYVALRLEKLQRHYELQALVCARQGLTLAHFSAQLERILWERGEFRCCLGDI